MKSSTPPSLTRLRDATRTVHKSLEELTNSDALLHAEPELGHYTAFLGAQYLLHKAVAMRATTLLDNDPRTQFLDWPECNRLNALQSDLDVLLFTANHLERKSDVIDSHASLLGLVYVCEGSCIGNQRLFSALNKHENFRDWNSSAFLQSCKTGFAQRWKPVIAAIDTLSESGSEVDGSSYDDIEQGALEGFDIFKSGWDAIQQSRTADTADV